MILDQISHMLSAFDLVMHAVRICQMSFPNTLRGLNVCLSEV